MLWGGWLLVTGPLLSYAKGIIHPYYTVALAPAVGAVVAIGAVSMWARRETWLGRAALATALFATTIWAYVLLGRTSSWMPELRTTVLVVGLGLAGALLLAPLCHRRIGLLVGGAALAIALAAPGAYTIDTVAVSHSGAIPSAGPTQAGATSGPGGVAGAGSTGVPGGASATGGQSLGGGPGTRPGKNGGFNGTPPSGTRTGTGASTGTPSRAAGGAPPGGARIGTAGGAAGGLLNASTPGAILTKLLEKDASRYTWVVATVGSNSAAGYQLATRDPVMAIGGFNGSDPTPTLAQFEKYVAEGKIHYFVAGGGTGGGGGPSSTGTGNGITAWVETHFKAVTVDGVTLYDLATSVH